MEININTCISKAFNEYGYSMEITKEEVEFSPLKIWITGRLDLMEEEEDGSFHSRVYIRTRHEELFPDGMYEYAYGLGETEEAATVNAVYRWIESDFNAIHDWLCTNAEHDHSDSKTEAVSFSEEEGVMAWEVILGPLIRTASEQLQEEIYQDDFFLKMFDTLNTYLLGYKGLYPIKCFVMVDQAGEISLDCRVNGQAWAEGGAFLKKYAESWGLKNETHWRKQYFIIAPKKIKELRNPELVSAVYEAENARRQKERKILTVDNRAVASNPGKVTLKSWVWAKNHLGEVLVLKFALIVSFVLTFGASYGFGVMAFMVLSYNVLYWIRKKEHFKLGDSNGGIIVSANPTLAAVTTDLSKGWGTYPVLKIIEYKTSKPVQIGDRIATVALYSASTDDDLPHWIDFHPIPIDYATDDQAEIERALLSYENDNWAVIERRIKQIPKPFKVGLYRVDLEESDWGKSE